MERNEPMAATRRSSAEVRRLALEAARALFTERGYAATTTKAVAARAGIAEAVVFRHFGTKRRLLEMSLVEPLADFAERYLAAWLADREPDRVELRARQYIEQIYDVLIANRQLLAVVVAEGSRPEPLPPHEDATGLGPPLDALFGRLEPMARNDFNAKGWRRQDTGMAIRMTFGLVASMVLLEDWLFVGRRAEPARELLIDAMVDFVLHGVTEPDFPPGDSGRAS